MFAVPQLAPKQVAVVGNLPGNQKEGDVDLLLLEHIKQLVGEAARASVECQRDKPALDRAVLVVERPVWHAAEWPIGRASSWIPICDGSQ